jgi:hypothetical protein
MDWYQAEGALQMFNSTLSFAQCCLVSIISNLDEYINSYRYMGNIQEHRARTQNTKTGWSNKSNLMR